MESRFYPIFWKRLMIPSAFWRSVRQRESVSICTGTAELAGIRVRTNSTTDSSNHNEGRVALIVATAHHRQRTIRLLFQSGRVALIVATPSLRLRLWLRHMSFNRAGWPSLLRRCLLTAASTLMVSIGPGGPHCCDIRKSIKEQGSSFQSGRVALIVATVARSPDVR